MVWKKTSAMPREVAATTDCPPDAAFADLLDGRLTEPDASHLRRHAAGCSTCGALLDALGTSATAAATPPCEEDDALARALLRAAATASGRILDRKYALGRLLGKGGMGEVYEADHLGTGRRVAVKLIRGRALSLGAEAESRFRREARAAAATRSPHIVEILDSGEDAETGDLYLVMEHLRGEDLQRLLDRVGPLVPEVALRITAQALLGLVKLHEAGTVHRDVKPANLFLARGDDGAITVKLLDFGIAKVTHEPLRAALTAGLTRADGMLGSPLYMSPEQMANSKAVDGRTDLWSLGSALYCALAGRAPLQHVENVFELLPAIRAGGAPPLRDRAPWVSAAMAEVVQRALAVDPSRRYPSAAAMLDALRPLLPGGHSLREEMLGGIPPEVRAQRPAPSRARLAVVAVALLGVAGAVRYATSPAPAPTVSPSAASAAGDAASAAPLALRESPASMVATTSPAPPLRPVQQPRTAASVRRSPPAASASAPSRDPMREHE